MLTANFSLLFLLVVFITNYQQSIAQTGDTRCFHKRYNVDGTCKIMRQCSSAIIDNRQGHAIEHCEKKRHICCPDPDKIPKPTLSRSSDSCPELSTDILKISKSQQKAKNKCIDWAELIYPCRSPILIGGPRVRDDHCLHIAKPLIINGSLAEPNEFPHMAHLGHEDVSNPGIIWSGGGSLISERWVLTAAHCIYNIQTQSDVKYVRLGGRSDLPTSSHLLYNVADIKVHPDYVLSSKYNDIALIKLDRNVKLSYTTVPACLDYDQKSLNPEIKKALTTGWGRTSTEGSNSQQLLKVILEIFKYDECQSHYGRNSKLRNGLVDETQICAGHHKYTNDACNGDSGGPLQLYNQDVKCTYTIIGITSSGLPGCGITGVPGLFTRVSAFLPWIEKIVWP